MDNSQRREFSRDLNRSSGGFELAFVAAIFGGIGLLIGPHALGWLPDTPQTRTLAEFGVVVLAVRDPGHRVHEADGAVVAGELDTCRAKTKKFQPELQRFPDRFRRKISRHRTDEFLRSFCRCFIGMGMTYRIQCTLHALHGFIVYMATFHRLRKQLH